MNRTTWSAQLSLPVSATRDHVRGAPDASITLLEYGDYECPFCGAAHLVVNALQARLRDQLRFAFRHFPLTTVHPHSATAAEAAEAAGAQSKFWPMHDLLYENQSRLDASHLLGYARILGLKLEQFASDLANHTHAGKVREDFMSGVRSGVNGTPTFYINGLRHEGAWDFPNLLAAVLAHAQSSPQTASR